MRRVAATRRLLVRKLRPPAQNRLTRCCGLIHPAAWCPAWCCMKTREITRAGFSGEGLQHFGELVERSLALGFGGLDQQCPVYNQREVHRHRMISLVDHRLGEVERRDAGFLQEVVVEQHFVHAGTWKRKAQIALEPNAQVIGVEYRILGHLPQSVGPVTHHIGERAHEHAHLPVESFQSADRLLRLTVLVLEQFKSRWGRAPATARVRRGPGSRPAQPGRFPARRRHAGWKRSCAGSNACNRCPDRPAAPSRRSR